MIRNRRAGVEDRWYKSNGEKTNRCGVGMRWRARYVDDRGREHAKAFERKFDATRWLDNQTAAVVTGTHVAPRDAQLTVQQWCDLWIEGYRVHRESTVRQARTHIRQIVDEFGGMPLSALRPSQVKAWLARLQAEGLSQNYVYSLHSRLSQIMSDAVHDGVLGRNPCSRRTAPPMGKQKVYVATTEQVWAIHDTMPDQLRVAVLLGAFAGLRVAEVSGCGSRTSTSPVAWFIRCSSGPLSRSRPTAAISRSRSHGTWRCCWRRRCRNTRRHDGHQWAGPTVAGRGSSTGPCATAEGEDRRPAGEVQLSRSAPLPGVDAHRLRCGHQDRAGADASRHRTNDSRHLRPSVAGRGRVHPFGGRCCDRGADGLVVEQLRTTADDLASLSRLYAGQRA